MPFLSSVSNILTALLPTSEAEQEDNINVVDNKALTNRWPDIKFGSTLKKLTQFTILSSVSNLASAEAIYNKALYFYANGTNYRLRYLHNKDSQGFIDSAQELMNGACGANITSNYLINYDDNACKAWDVIITGAKGETYSDTAADLCPASNQLLDELFLKCISPMLDAATAALQQKINHEDNDVIKNAGISMGVIVSIALLGFAIYRLRKYLQQNYPSLENDTESTYENSEEVEPLISDIKVDYYSTDDSKNRNVLAHKK